MQCLKWTMESNGVSVPEIDAEHEMLFRLADEIYQSMQAGATLAAVEPTLRDLFAHVGSHFASEEQRMRSKRYPAMRWHKGQHDTVRGKIAALEQSIRQGDREAIMPALEFLTAWLQTHTAVSDRMMAAYFRTRGWGRPRK